MNPAQVLLLAFVLAALVKVIHSHRQRRLVPLDLLFWGLVWMGTASVIIFPEATSWLAHRLGIGRGADLIMYTSLLISFYLIFRLYVALARLEHAITALVRAHALAQLPGSVDSSASQGD
jgi:small membrane protein